jgi:hypothetical protein
MKKITLNKWKLIQWLLSIFTTVIFVIWYFAFFIQFFNATVHQDFSMFQIYGEIALTLFGFTLIGGIFEKNNHKEIEINLFDSSLSFLAVSMAFFFMYSLSSIFAKEIMPFSINPTSVIVIVAFSCAMLVGFVGFIAGFLKLYQTLIDYRISIDSKIKKRYFVPSLSLGEEINLEISSENLKDKKGILEISLIFKDGYNRNLDDNLKIDFELIKKEGREIQFQSVSLNKNLKEINSSLKNIESSISKIK